MQQGALTKVSDELEAQQVADRLLSAAHVADSQGDVMDAGGGNGRHRRVVSLLLVCWLRQSLEERIDSGTHRCPDVVQIR